MQNVRSAVTVERWVRVLGRGLALLGLALLLAWPGIGPLGSPSKPPATLTGKSKLA